MRYWREIAVGLILLLILGMVLWWLLSPLVIKKDVEVASNQIVDTTETVVEDKERESAKVNEETARSIQVAQRKTSAAVASVPSGDSGDAAFYNFVCDSRLYRADPQRESKGC